MSPRGTLKAIFAAALGLASCADLTPYQRGDDAHHGRIGRLAVRAQSYNPSHTPLGAVQLVVDDGSQVIVLAAGMATLLRGGTVTGAVSGHTFPIAAAIPAADGNGQWLVGVDTDGQLYRLRAGRDFEKVSERYGFNGTAVRAVCAVSGRSAAFLLAGDELAVADGQSVTRYPLALATAGSAAPRLACGGGRAAVVLAAEVRTFAPTTHALRSFPIAAVGAAFDGRGRLVVASASALYIEGAGGQLELRYRPTGSERPLRAVTSATSRIWFMAGDELGVVEPDQGDAADRIAVTHGAQLLPSTQLVGSATGDVWVLTAGKLRRVGRDDDALPPSDEWAQRVGPVFARACTPCHLPGGRAGVDLSSAAAWDNKRALIRERVVTQRSMPPAGSGLAEADRAAIAAWLDREP